MATLKMALPHKRKRGRPRNDEPKDIKEFDLSLIQEFKKRPAFYDRSHPQYRNREHLEPQWNIIAHSLGYSVPVLKNRMMQLRNRYSLEKRRMETIREQCGDGHEVVSPWSLFNELEFLGDHIKGRLHPIQKEDVEVSIQASDTDDGEMHHSAGIDTSIMNGYGHHGHHNTSQLNQSAHYNQQSHHQQQQQQQHRHQQQEHHSQQSQHHHQQQQQHLQQQPRQSQRQQYRQMQLQMQREKELREQAQLQIQHRELLRQQQQYYEQQKIEHERQQLLQQQQQQQIPPEHNREYNREENSNGNSQANSESSTPMKKASALDLLHLSGTDSKYVAFGQFISSSLIELSEADALRLVEKFTSEIIKAVLQSQTSNSTKQKD